MSEREQIEQRERDFFDDYYEEERCHPVGTEEIQERERRALVAAAGGGSLGRVLSIGCGNGRFELKLAPHAESLVALDLSAPAIETARRLASEAGVGNVEFRCQSAADLDWNERFDTIVCLAFLHHVPEPDLPALLAKIHDHLNPDGFFYAQDPNVHGILRSLGRLVLRSGYDDYHSADERELDPEELRRLLRSAGFARVDVGFVDLTLIPMHYYAPSGPDALMRLCRVVDRVWCATPLRRWASGFNVIARRAGS